MKKEMKLKCWIYRLDETGRYPVVAHLFDNSEFTLRVFPSDVQFRDQFADGIDRVDGWVHVISEGQQGDRVSITLPQPSDVHGRQVVVSEYSLMPRHVDINAFNPQ